MKGFIFFVIILLLTSSGHSGESVDCVSYVKNSGANPDSILQAYKNCGAIVKGKIILSRKHLKQLRFDEHDIGSVLVCARHYHVKPDGSMLSVVTFDNWADYYSEGLTRSAVNGKIAYYNRDFRQVVAPQYDWGWPFINDRALVCKGCTIQPQDEDGHQRITGGLWGYINKKGEEIIPIKFTQSEAGRM